MKLLIHLACAVSCGLSCLGCADGLDPAIDFDQSEYMPARPVGDGFCSSLCEAMLQCDDSPFVTELGRARLALPEDGTSFADCTTLCTSGAVAPRGYAVDCLASGEPAEQCLFVADVMDTPTLCESLNANWGLDLLAPASAVEY